jgi:hypothetical protein
MLECPPCLQHPVQMTVCSLKHARLTCNWTVLLLTTCCAGEPLDRHQIMAEIGIMWGAGFEVSASCSEAAATPSCTFTLQHQCQLQHQAAARNTLQVCPVTAHPACM